MKPYVLVALVVCGCLVNGVSRGDTVDDAEAKKRNVPVQQIQLERAQQRIAELEKRIAELENPTVTKPNAATQSASSQPATGPKLNGFDALEKWYTTAPANLMPTEGEMDSNMQSRFEWFKRNIKLNPVQHISGKIIAAKAESYSVIIPMHTEQVTRQVAVPGSVITKPVTETKTVPESRQTDNGIGVDLQTDDMTIWGKQFPVYIHVFMKNVSASEAGKWTPGKVVECSGQVVALLDPYEAVVKENNNVIAVGKDFSRTPSDIALGVCALETRRNLEIANRKEVKVIIVGTATR
jgi:hypothetical protein